MTPNATDSRSYYGAKAFCQLFYHDKRSDVRAPSLYQSRTVGQYVYSRFLTFDNDAPHITQWVGAVLMNRTPSTNIIFDNVPVVEGLSWYWDGPDESATEKIPDKVSKYITDLSGYQSRSDRSCLTEVPQPFEEVIKPEHIRSLLDGNSTFTRNWYRSTCETPPHLAILCQKDIPIIAFQNTSLSVVLEHNSSDWKTYHDGNPNLTCKVSGDGVMFNSPVVFVSSWFTYETYLFNPAMIYQTDLSKAMDNVENPQFAFDEPSNPESSELQWVHYRRFCLYDGRLPHETAETCVPEMMTRYPPGGLGWPVDYMILRSAGYYQCGVISASTHQWVSNL